MHLERGLSNPLTNDYNLQCVLRGVRRVKGDMVTRKLPLTPVHLRWILSTLDVERAADANVWAAILVAFFALLRRSNVAPVSQSSFDSLKHTRRRDIQVKPDRLDVSIRWSKTIQFRERVLVIPIPRIKCNPLCPVVAAFRAFKLTPEAKPDGPAFITGTGRPIIVSDIVAAMKNGVQQGGFNPDDFSGHSLRRGGATLAYQAGVSIDTIRQLGDWRSDAYTKYVFDSYGTLYSSLHSVVTLCS